MSEMEFLTYLVRENPQRWMGQ